MSTGSVHDDYAAFELLLRSIATSLVADRSEATVYMHCRPALLASDYRAHLPGFVFQCITAFKFREFISLYDPAAEERVRFVRTALADAAAHHGTRAPAAAQPSQAWGF